MTLPDAEVAAIRARLRERPGATPKIDLAAQTVTDPAGQVRRFDIHPVRRKYVLSVHL
ncbi:MAG: hypothetical protein HYY78_00930 [Betaproteobacteria bacterium]|nr:hypothetical protein [Betaproteobacteria bacterium]